jgi:hypothetical protein
MNRSALEAELHACALHADRLLVGLTDVRSGPADSFRSVRDVDAFVPSSPTKPGRVATARIEREGSLLMHNPLCKSPSTAERNRVNPVSTRSRGGTAEPVWTSSASLSGSRSDADSPCESHEPGPDEEAALRRAIAQRRIMVLKERLRPHSTPAISIAELRSRSDRVVASVPSKDPLPRKKLPLPMRQLPLPSAAVVRIAL